MNGKPVMTGIALTEYEKEILTRESERRGLYNLSAAARQIIREWDEMNKTLTSPAPFLPDQTAHQAA